MTQEVFEAKQAAMSNKELIEQVEKQISELARSGGKSHRMCVPPMITDTDMLLSEMVKRFKRYSQKIGFAYMPTTIYEMEHQQNIHNIDGHHGIMPKNHHDKEEMNRFPEDKGFQKREALKNVKKNPLLGAGDYSKTTLKDIPENWLPQIGQEYWTCYKPSRTVHGPFIGEALTGHPEQTLNQNDWKYFPTRALAQEYQKSKQELSPNWDNADLEDVPVDWMPEKGQTGWAIVDGEAVMLQHDKPVWADGYKVSRSFPTAALAQQYLSSLVNPVERWKPELGEKYWWVTIDYGVNSSNWSGDTVDGRLYRAHNCFRGEAKALAAANKVREVLAGNQ